MKHIYFLGYLSLLIFGNFIYAAPTVYKYRIYCNTESANVYQWAETGPATCPNNTAHSINLNSISIVDQQGPSIFAIKEETISTGGHYRTESKKISANAGPNVITSIQFSWPYDVSVLAIYMSPDSSSDGDSLTITVGANTILGILTQDIAAGVTTIPVSSSVITNIAKGYYVSVDDGNNADNLARVIAIDAINNTITTELATTHSFTAASPTYIKVNVRPVDQLELVAGLQYALGMKKIGGSFIPANTVVTVDYFNKTNVAKNLVFAYEYLY